MKVHVRDIEASCACGSREFRAPPHPPPYELGEMLSCAACGGKTTYGALLEAIGEEAIARANRALESLKRDILGRRSPKKRAPH